MKTIAAILLVLMAPSAVMARSDHAFATPRNVRIDVEGPLHLSARREGERFAKKADTGSQHKARVRHPVMLGVIIGAGAGFLLNATMCRTGESVCTQPGNLLAAGIGAGIGATIGALVSR